MISPYLFFWQAAEEVEETRHARGRRVRVPERLHNRALDISVGMLFSNVVTYFVILATASTLHANGQTNVQTAADAARALEPLVGGAATILFSIGLIGAGFLAVPVLTRSAAYAVAGALHLREGLDRPFSEARAFYGVMIGATLVGVVLNFIGIKPFDALFLSALINGMLAPPLLVLIMLLANRKSVMRARTNGPALNILGWATTIVMSLAAVGVVLTSGT